MTNHDVAGVVERLRAHINARGGPAKDDDGKFVGTVWPMMLEAAALIESQAKALSEAEAEIEKLRARPPLLDAKSLPRVDALINATEARALAAEATAEKLAGAVKDMHASGRELKARLAEAEMEWDRWSVYADVLEKSLILIGGSTTDELKRLQASEALRLVRPALANQESQDA
jgi:hypothetical protein